MPIGTLIMLVVAAAFALPGLWLLLQLRRPLPEGRVYAYRMAGIMALAGAAVLVLAAALLWPPGARA